VIGVLVAVWIWPSILLQIRFGDVGREPGCPTCCRCRCCGDAVPRGMTRAVKIDAMGVQTDEDTLPVTV